MFITPTLWSSPFSRSKPSANISPRFNAAPSPAPPHFLASLNSSSATCSSPPLPSSACCPRSSRAILFTEALSNQVTSRSGTGSGSRPPSSTCSSHPITASLHGRPFFFSPSSDSSSFGAANRSSALRCSPPSSPFTFSSPVTPIGLASLPTATAFSFLSLHFSFSASPFSSIAPLNSSAPAEPPSPLLALFSPSSLSVTLASCSNGVRISFQLAALSLFLKLPTTNSSWSPASSPPTSSATSSSAKPSCSRSKTATSSSSKKILLRHEALLDSLNAATLRMFDRKVSGGLASPRLYLWYSSQGFSQRLEFLRYSWLRSHIPTSSSRSIPAPHPQCASSLRATGSSCASMKFGNTASSCEQI